MTIRIYYSIVGDKSRHVVVCDRPVVQYSRRPLTSAEHEAVDTIVVGTDRLRHDDQDEVGRNLNAMIYDCGKRRTFLQPTVSFRRRRHWIRT